jgi:hypothetical protein
MTRELGTCPFCNINVYWPETERSCSRRDCETAARQVAADEA